VIVDARAWALPTVSGAFSERRCRGPGRSSSAQFEIVDVGVIVIDTVEVIATVDDWATITGSITSTPTPTDHDQGPTIEEL